MNLKSEAPRARAAHPAGVLAARAASALALVMFAAVLAHAQPAQEAADARQKYDDAAKQKAEDAPRQKTDEVTNAPPPMLYLPEDVRHRLEGEADLKARTHLALDLAEERLARAAERADADRFEEATAELGVYEALVADAVRSVQTSGRSKGKQRDILKRVEMTLRSHVPRIETIRRELPAAHAAYFKSAIEFVNEQRDLALNTFYDDNVIRERVRDKAAVGERANGTGPATPDNEKKPERR